MSLTHEVPNQTHVTSYHSEKILTNYDDELRFTHTFSEDTEITGNMNLKLWVSTEETDDMDIFAGIKNSINRVKKFISLTLTILKMDK